MDRLRPERKGFGLPRPTSGSLDIRALGERNGTNGHVEKSAASLAQSLGFSLTPTLAGNEEITQPYLESWVVHACCRLWADCASQVGFKVWTGPEENAGVLKEDHPVVKLFSKPNPWTSWSQLVEMGSIHRNLSGEDFWFLADARGNPIVGTYDESGKQTGKPPSLDPMEPIDLPVQIQSLNGTYIGDERTKRGQVGVWKYSSTAGGEVKFPVGSVMHFRNYDPTDPCRGVGPAEVALRQLSIAFQAERYGEATLRAGGPGAFIVYEHEMTPEAQRVFQEELDTETKKPESVGSFKVLTGKPNVIPIPVSPKDMLSIDQLAWSRGVVASLFGVPLPLIGVLDNATYSNMTEAWRQFWLRVAAYLKTVEDVINTSFFPRLKNESMRNLRFGFDLSNVTALKKDDKELIDLALKITAGGVGITMNDALKLVGSQAENVTGGDTPLFLAQMQTAPSEPRKQAAAKLMRLLKEEIEHGTADQEA